MSFRYIVFHIPTGKKENSVSKFPSRSIFLEKLNEWNRKAPGVYQYFDQT